MTLIDVSSYSSETTASDPTTTIIIFECNDFRRDNTGLILLKRTKSNNEKFELHLYDDYTKNQAIVMILYIKDLARMFESLEEYFNQSPNRGNE